MPKKVLLKYKVDKKWISKRWSQTDHKFSFVTIVFSKYEYDVSNNITNKKIEKKMAL